MRWKQFFTPVESMDANHAKKFIDESTQGSVTILDVRQPKEYESGHIPGAKLIPLPEIKDRMDEIDPDRPTVVYCAIGGRSRVAAQMLAGKGFKKVYNLSGGIKAWNGNTAQGPADQGLELFNGKESIEEVLIVAYSLEKGLMDFYQQMTTRATVPPVKELFHKLTAIEINHQNRLLGEYNRITGKSLENLTFDSEIVSPAMEGGLSTEEYLQLFNTDLDSPAEVVGMAMSIEAQALDMYHRASENAKDPDSSEVLRQIAIEEQEHLKLLGELFEKM
jgi:rhodanese-related sulfurtransferase/rubrerythrin